MSRPPGSRPHAHAQVQEVSLVELFEMFRADTTRESFESIIWPTVRGCGHCGSANTIESQHQTMPYRCRDCSQYFSVKTGRAIESSKIGLRKWAITIYFELTRLKGVSSMKPHHDLGVVQRRRGS